MDSESKVVSVLLALGAIVLIVGFLAGKGCQQSDNVVRAKAVEKGCLILQNEQYDCRGVK